MENDHYFTKNPTSVEHPRTISIFVNGKNILFKTSSSMFSPKRIDPATLLLIENMQLPEGTPRVLDMGAGYGPIGICAAIGRPSAEIVMAEINERASRLAKENVIAARTTNVTVVESDFFSNITGSFDVILSNPPIAIGMKCIEEFIRESKTRLNQDGSLQLVARHNKGGSRIAGMMENVFGNCDTITKGGGFRVYIAYNSK